MEPKLFEAHCKHCTDTGIDRDAPEARVTGLGDSTKWRHDITPAKPHSPWPVGTWRQIFTRKAVA